ncbi:MAG: DUF3298 domain-containing protein [Clostridiales bacterium]|nr:DUF3298 and DUF4163 domain-containing protein [Eubacteriales bacterium]MDH7566774.1 DUF3298 domain-containing protein [Clostridiales bacterium]
MSWISRNPVVVITRKMVIPNQEADISYPVVVGMANFIVQQKINTQIVTLVNRVMAEQVDRLIQQGYKELHLSVSGFYELKTNERDVLSLTIGNYTFAYPAAHGLTMIRSLTFDTNTGKSYLLSEQFKQGSDYIKVLSDQIKEQIRERKIVLLNDLNGIEPEQDYYIADKCLVVYFQLYQLTAYVFGFPMFPISVYDIEDIIREDSPLGRMSTND